MRVFSPGRLDALERLYNKINIMEYDGLTTQRESLKGNSRAIREERNRLDTLISEKFGGRRPVYLRPTPTRWQGYEKPAPPDTSDGPHSIFDPNLIVLAIKGRRVPGYDYAQADAGAARLVDGLLPGTTSTRVVQRPRARRLPDDQPASGNVSASVRRQRTRRRARYGACFGASARPQSAGRSALPVGLSV